MDEFDISKHIPTNTTAASERCTSSNIQLVWIPQIHPDTEGHISLFIVLKIASGAEFKAHLMGMGKCAFGRLGERSGLADKVSGVVLPYGRSLMCAIQCSALS